MRSSLRFALLIALVPFAVSCSDNATALRTDIITVKPDQGVVTLASGGTTSIGVTIIRPVGYAGPITLDVATSGAGVSATVSPSTLPEGSSTSTVTISADAGTTSSTGSLTVRAGGTGITTQSATVGVVVGSTTGSGSFTMIASPSVVIVPKGGTATIDISINRTGGFVDPVSIDVSGFGGDIFTSGSSSIVSSGSVQISVSSTARPGTYSGTITASGGGIVQTAGVTVTVTGIGGG